MGYRGVATFNGVPGIPANIATQVTDRLHVGAQMYVRSIGRLGAYDVQLDWAYADYRVKDWLGFRGGKVKTPLGLYNDTQDMGFLHPWVLLPQSVYPTDLRSTTIAHTGGDVYGTIDLKRAGSVSYSAYGGQRPVDLEGGFIFGLQDQGFSKLSYSGYNAGYDVRWATPIKGLKVGTSYMYSPLHIDASAKTFPVSSDGVFKTKSAYAEYRRKGLTLASEYRSEPRHMEISVAGKAQPARESTQNGFFVSAAYRFTPWFQLGTYNSRFSFQGKAVPGLLPAADSYIHDQAVTARFDFLKHWDFKIEGHFMDGVGSPTSAHGFYLSDNPQGLQQKTKMIALRLGFNI